MADIQQHMIAYAICNTRRSSKTDNVVDANVDVPISSPIAFYIVLEFRLANDLVNEVVFLEIRILT
jgi:hypothetical protein